LRREMHTIGYTGGGELPTYDYRCTKCGDEFSVEQSIKDRPLARCRKCRGKLEKLLPKSLNLIFKGSGFYITDYKKSDGKGKECSVGPPAKAPASETSETRARGNDTTEKKSGGRDTT
jgi:putative FmdB family regulatory protein